MRLWSAQQSKIENGTWHERAPALATIAKAFEDYRAYSKVQNRSHSSYVEPALSMGVRSASARMWRRCDGVRPSVRVDPAGLREGRAFLPHPAPFLSSVATSPDRPGGWSEPSVERQM